MITRDYISPALVKYLRRENQMTLKQLASVFGLSESFISRVGKGERSFTLKHLVQLEAATRQPLPILILRAMNDSPIPPHLARIYSLLGKLDEKLSALEPEKWRVLSEPDIPHPPRRERSDASH